VLLADGCLRRLDHPKKKKFKHIRVEPAAPRALKPSFWKENRYLTPKYATVC
jgi:hypothetical protein